MGMGIRDDVRGQLEWWILLGIGQPGEAVAVAEHSANAVTVTQREGQRADDVVESGAQTAARDDGHRDLGGVEREQSPRPCFLERRRNAARLEEGDQVAGVGGTKDAVIVVHELQAAVDQRARKGGRADRSHAQLVGIREAGIKHAHRLFPVT